MKKVLKAICDGVLTLACYALFAAIMAAAIVIAPIVCVTTALKDEIKLSEALEAYIRGLAEGFYEAFNK